MRERPLPRYGRIALLLPAIPLMACSLSIPFLQSNGSAGGQTASNNAPGVLGDPQVGLADLASYHASYHQDIVGTSDGEPFERHTHIELTRASGQSDFLQEFQGTDEPASYLRSIGAGPTAYRWNSPDDTCQGTEGGVFPEENLEPADLLLPVLETTKLGAETVNQIPAVHHQFDQNALALSDPKPSITGDLWLAVDGGYVVKYTLSAAMPETPTGQGMETAQTWSYELSQVNAVDSVTLPPGCMPVPVDLPVMADAKDVSRISGWLEYGTASSAAQVVDFYYQTLPSLGWTAEGEEPTGELKLPVGLAFSQGDLSLSINIDSADAGGLDVSILIYNPEAQAAAETPAASTPETAATLGPQPTVEESESGLPEDVPLYPGAAGLTQLSDEMIRFQTEDAKSQVDQTYQDDMPIQGWTLLSRTEQGGGVIQAWTKDERIVTVTIMPQGNKTIVMIGFPTL